MNSEANIPKIKVPSLLANIKEAGGAVSGNDEFLKYQTRWQSSSQMTQNDSATYKTAIKDIYSPLPLLSHNIKTPVYGTYFPKSVQSGTNSYSGQVDTPLWIHDWRNAKLPSPQYTPLWANTFSSNGENIPKHAIVWPTQAPYRYTNTAGYGILSGSYSSTSISSGNAYFTSGPPYPNYFDTVSTPKKIPEISTSPEVTVNIIDVPSISKASVQDGFVLSSRDPNARKRERTFSMPITCTNAIEKDFQGIAKRSRTVSTPLSGRNADKSRTKFKGKPSLSLKTSKQDNSTNSASGRTTAIDNSCKTYLCPAIPNSASGRATSIDNSFNNFARPAVPKRSRTVSTLLSETQRYTGAFQSLANIVLDTDMKKQDANENSNNDASASKKSRKTFTSPAVGSFSTTGRPVTSRNCSTLSTPISGAYANRVRTQSTRKAKRDIKNN